MKLLRWTPELAYSFWSDLAGSKFLAETAFSRFAAPYLVDLVQDHINKEDAILDFGAGPNLYLVQELLRRGFRVGFYEPSPSLTASNIKLESNGQFLGAVSDLDSQKYECVFFSEVIEHLTDKSLKDVLTTLARIVKSGGLLVVTTPDSENLFNASRYCPVCKHLFHPWGHVRSFNSEQLRMTLANHGFHCEEIHSVDFSAAREPMEELKRLRETIAGMVRDFTKLQERNAIASQEVSWTLKKYMELLIGIAGPHVSEDPKHRHIGFGGTLVAFARRQDVQL